MAGVPFGVATKASAAPGPGRFYVSVKRAEFRRDWNRLWEMLHPGQRAFISRKTFVDCFRRQHIRNPPLRSISVATVRSRALPIPGVTRIPVAAKVVTVRILFGAGAPSQRASGQVTLASGHWYWITNAGSTHQFRRINFCS